MTKHSRAIEEFWNHDELGDIQVISAGNFPDTVIVRVLEGEFKGDEVQVYITDLISTAEASAALAILLGPLTPGQG